MRILQRESKVERSEIQAPEFLADAAISIITAYTKTPGLRLVLSLGSQTMRTSDTLSDFDLVLVYDAGAIPPKEARQQLVADTFPRSGITDASFADTARWTVGVADDFNVDGVRLDMMIFTWPELLGKIDEILQGRYHPEGLYHPLGFLSILEGAVVHVDKDGLFPIVQQKLSPYPQTLQKIILEEETTVTFPYYVRQLERAQVRGDLIAASDLVHGALTSTIYTLLARHKIYYRAPKYVMRQLEKIAGKDSELWKLVHFVAEKGTTAHSITQKRQMLQRLHTMAVGGTSYTLP